MTRIPALFHPAQTLDCGQAFRWRQRPEDPAKWEGAAFGQVLTIKEEAGELVLSCGPQELEQTWRRYFDLAEDYDAARRALAGVHPALGEAAAFAPGIRILRQEPWEALCSFILSQNNHIGRIKGILGRFCQQFGEAIPGTDWAAFPSPERVAGLSLEDLAPLRCGYRGAYVLDAARQVAGGLVDLERIDQEPAAFGREELQRIKGVGPKVAECALLYGFHKTECFPMDVWMKRAMAALLPGVRPEGLGRNAGLAQQYIFHYSRMHPELFQ